MNDSHGNSQLNNAGVEGFDTVLDYALWLHSVQGLNWKQIQFHLEEREIPYTDIMDIKAIFETKIFEEEKKEEQEEISQNQENGIQYMEENNLDNRGMFLRPFSFKGRIRRLEYGISTIIYFLTLFGIRLLQENNENGFLGFLLLGINFIVWFFWISQAVKRAHDRNAPGPYIIIPFYFIYLLFAPSDKNTNYYGNPPKDNEEEFSEAGAD